MIDHWPSGAVEVDGASLHYVRGGTGSRVLVLLHGITDDGPCWARVADALSQSFDIVIPDARGHGRSSRIGTDGFSVDRLAADVVGLLDGLGISDAVLFGHSMGAITAAVAAGKRPDLVRCLVLEDPPLDVPRASATDRRRALLGTLDEVKGVSAVERHARARRAHPEWAAVETDPWIGSKAAVDPEIGDYLDLFDGLDWRRVFDGLTVPGLLVTGEPEKGAIVTPIVAEDVTSRWRGGRTVHIDGAGHSIHRDRWDASMEMVSAYLVGRT